MNKIYIHCWCVAFVLICQLLGPISRDLDELLLCENFEQACLIY